MHIFVVMIEMYMLCVSSDISHHILYVVLYHVGLFSLLEFEINYLSIYIGRRCDFFCLLPVGVCIDAYVTICSYVLCVSTH